MPSSPVKPVWSEVHEVALNSRMIEIVLANRTLLYTIPELADFTGHGASKINDKAQQQLKKFAKAVTGQEGVVEAIVAQGTKGKRGGAAAKTREAGGSKASGKESVSPGKKRKAVEMDTRVDVMVDSDS